MKIQHFLGIDISADTLDVCVLLNNEVILEQQIGNRHHSIRMFLSSLKRRGITRNNTFVCAEHTGVYGDLLRLILEEAEMVYFIVPAMEIKRSIGMTRGKNDRVDARRIADYCCRFMDRLSPSKLPAKYLKNLKSLSTYRDSRVKARTAMKNQLKQYKKVQPSSPRNYIINDLKMEIAREDERIGAIEAKMIRIIKDAPDAISNFNLITSIKGVGPIIAIHMIVVTENFSLFNNARKFASYAGVAPFTHQSGKSLKGKNKTSPLRNKQSKTLLLNGVNAAIKGENELGKYYRRKLDEGKNKNVVKNAVAFKLLGRIFAVVKRKSAYVETYKNKIAA